MPKIYDCVMFFNELDMLELRFNILNDVVDYFVVCEATETHSGQYKPLNLLANWDRFKPWHSKIIYVNAGPLSDGRRNSWERERYHRSQIANGLVGAQAQDWVIVADCDEIPDPGVVSDLNTLKNEVNAIKIELDFYYYDMNHRVDQGWAIGGVRHGRESDANKIRTCVNEPWVVYQPGGWHFSYFGGPQAIIQKHAAFMHHGDPVIADMPHDPAYITERVQASLDLYGRDLPITHVPTSDHLPQYVLDNIDQYRNMGWVE